MASNSVTHPLIVIVGPTASGKTALGIEVARKYNGEIICADSRTIYKGMDIGTAKPTDEECQLIPHWGLDLVEPNERYSVGQFKTYCEEAIEDIRGRGKLPIIVGGTGLYIDSVIFDFAFGASGESSWRKRIIDNSIIVGIATEKAELHQRIAQRTEQLFSQGVVDEAIMLGKKYGWQSPGMTGSIYPILHDHLLGELTIEQAMEKFTTSDRRLAKRQMTWFRPNPFIEWCHRSEAMKVIQQHIASE